jgi:thymidylate synthase ThyX
MMVYCSKVVQHSVSRHDIELMTLEVTLPRIVLAEFNTHRQFSRNSASSRAIPVKKMIERVEQDPFIPIWWGKNQKGMQAAEELSPPEIEKAKRLWLQARDNAVRTVKTLSGITPSQTLDADDNLEVIRLDVHKQIANRLLEPFLWQTVIVTATEWSNFFAQRCHRDAQPEIRMIADMMRDTMVSSVPQEIEDDEWHLPYLQKDERSIDLELQKELSVARCARVSYLTQNGEREHEADYLLFKRLTEGMHWSPFEHVARPLAANIPSGNFVGWHQFRKDFATESR